MLNLVFTGSIDHGKSTLIGRVLYETNSLPEEKIEEVKNVCEKLGRRFEFAYILDALEEEREKQITIDTTQIFFSWKGREFCIIDAPGHREFLKNMLTGASQADAAVLIVSAKEGVEEQTKRHALLLRLLGIEKIVVAINKMDAVNYAREAFERVKKEVEDYLRSIGMEVKEAIPISAMEGDNIATPSENMPWYSGKTLLQVLGEIEERKISGEAFALPVQDVYEKNGEKICAGNIASGRIRKGECVLVLPEGREAKVKKILAPAEIEEASYPKAIGIVLETAEVKRGNVIAARKNAVKITETLEANIFALANFTSGTYEFCCSTQKIPCGVEVLEKLDVNTLKPVPEKILKNGDVAKVSIALASPAVIGNFYKIPELGKFTLEKNSETVAGGILL